MTDRKIIDPIVSFKIVELVPPGDKYALSVTWMGQDGNKATTIHTSLSYFGGIVKLLTKAQLMLGVAKLDGKTAVQGAARAMSTVEETAPDDISSLYDEEGDQQ